MKENPPPPTQDDFPECCEHVLRSAAIVIGLVVISYFLGINFPDLDKGFFPQVVATIIGVAAGVPIALAIERWKNLTETKNENEKLRCKEKDFEKILLEEVVYNIEAMNKRYGDIKRDPNALPSNLLKQNLWIEAVSSGDVLFLKTEVKRVVSESYFYLRSVHFYEERAFVAATGINVVFPDGKSAASVLITYARGHYTNLTDALIKAAGTLEKDLGVPSSNFKIIRF